MLTRRHVLVASTAGFVSASSDIVLEAIAQTESKPLHIILGFPAGGMTDVAARLLAERLTLSYATTVIVENKPGASGRLALENVKNSTPDGSVLLITPEGPIVVFPHIFRKLTYDPLRDLTPVAPVAKSMLAFIIGSAVPQNVRSLSEFMEWCKANPSHATFGAVAGSGPHFVGFMLARAAGVPIVHVPYKGSAVQDLLGGHVSAGISLVGDAATFDNTRQLRILAVTGLQRSRILPDVATFLESGYDIVAEPSIGIFAPARLAPEILRLLNAAIGEVVTSPKMVEQLAKYGAEPTFKTPEEFASMIRADFERWGPVVRASGFLAD